MDRKSPWVRPSFGRMLLFLSSSSNGVMPASCQHVSCSVTRPNLAPNQGLWWDDAPCRSKFKVWCGDRARVASVREEVERNDARGWHHIKGQTRRIPV
jgi:hypothetical protein